MKVIEKKMRTKLFTLTLAFFILPYFVHAGVLVSSSFENGYGQFDSNYGGSEIVADATAPNGKYSLRFNFTANFPAGNAPDIVSSYNFADQEEVYIKYYVKYSSNWVDEPLTNKMVYIWFGDHLNKPNLPFMGRSQYGDGVWAVLQAGGSIPEQVWFGNNFTLTYGVWHKIVLRVKMNTGGNHNGIFQAWVDDVLRINASNGYFRNSGDSYGVTAVHMTPVYGGGINTGNSLQYMWFDDIIVQTTPFGASPTSIPPAAPTRLTIQ